MQLFYIIFVLCDFVALYTAILFPNEDIRYGNALEAPRLGVSNEYHKICFHGEIRK